MTQLKSTQANAERCLFVNEEMSEPLALSACSGQVAVFCRRCPGKTTDNEDAAAIVRTAADEGVLAVADGMGGGAAGERASRIAVESLTSAVSESAVAGHPLRAGVLNGIEAANQAILDLGIGAASTLAAIEVQGDSVRPYHVGDSVILVVGQRGKIKLQTVPHSPVGLAVEAGVIEDADAMHHEERHLVTNILGTAEMRIEIGPTIRLSRFDTVVLASDGLFDNLTVAEVVEEVRQGPLEAAVARLAQTATERMTGEGESDPCKPDDLTIVAFRRLG